MREIKFRAWDKESKFMLTCGHYINSLELGINGILSLLTTHLDGEHSFMIDNFELMQYTGLKDKNGKEIYEGDIVKGHISSSYDDQDFISKVYIDSGCTTVDVDRNYSPCLYECHNKHLEIIGNIYKNPELLGENNV